MSECLADEEFCAGVKSSSFTETRTSEVEGMSYFLSRVWPSGRQGSRRWVGHAAVTGLTVLCLRVHGHCHPGCSSAVC